MAFELERILRSKAGMKEHAVLEGHTISSRNSCVTFVVDKRGERDEMLLGRIGQLWRPRWLPRKF